MNDISQFIILTFTCILIDILETLQRFVTTIANQSRNRVQQAVHVAAAGRIAHLALQRLRSIKEEEQKLIISNGNLI